MEFVLSCINISIHAPREGSDKQGHGTISPTTHFYPRSPRGERPGAEGLATAYSRISIHAPREGSDGRCGCSRWRWSHFYPRSPRGERPYRLLLVRPPGLISIHAPREGSDLPVPMMNILNGGISIHAPREGSDAAAGWAAPQREDFYPRSPRGERQRYDETGHPYLVFLSTLPARGATRQIRRLEHIR